MGFGLVTNDIQVSGSTNFLQARWRDAILFYLFGVWGNRRNVMYRPKIAFDDITLRLDTLKKEYYAYGHASVPEEVPPILPADMVAASCKQADVEWALICFVKNDQIRQLRLRLPSVSSDATFVLWKKTKRGEYGYAGLGLPYSWGTKGPCWTREEYEHSL